MPSQLPSDNQHRWHVAAVVAAGVLAVVMVAAAVWAITRPKPSAQLLVAGGVVATTTSAGVVPTSSAGVTTSPNATQTATGSTSGTGTAGAPTRKPAGPRIAFHLGRSLYIAKEDGKSATPMHIVGTEYALSPDGLTVAAVEKGKLVVANVGEHLLANSPETPGLSAEVVAPVWTPDSRGLYFIRSSVEGAPRVWHYDRALGETYEVMAGSQVAVSPDGKTIAVMPTEEATMPVVTIQTIGAATPRARIKAPSGDAVAIALSNERVFISCVSPLGTSTLWSFSLDGSAKKVLVGTGDAGGASATYGELIVSPDGAKLLFAADGDDGYSRLYTVPVNGGSLTGISGRRDGYAIGWTDDGSGILFIEGNAYQGQSTALMRSDTTGHRRTTLVKDATL